MTTLFFFKQKTAYEIGTGDWSSDVCSSDLDQELRPLVALTHYNKAFKIWIFGVVDCRVIGEI